MSDISLKDYYGCKTVGDLIIDNYYYTLYNSLMSDKEIYNINNRTNNLFRLPIYSKKIETKIKQGIKLFDTLGIKLRDVDVVDLSEVELDETMRKDVYSKACKKMHPSLIPLFLYDTLIMFGDYQPAFGELEVLQVNDILKKNGKKNAFTGVCVEKNNVNISQSFYNHEIVHTQLSNMPSSFSDLLDEEVLPIFFEELTALYMHPSKCQYIRNIRLYDVAEKINYLLFNFNKTGASDIICKKYISSSLKAIRLVDIYINGDTNTKKSIIEYIQMIFNGYLNVDGLLSKYEIDLDDSKRDIKTLKKI